MSPSLPQGYENQVNLVRGILGHDAIPCLENTISTLAACIDTLMSEHREYYKTSFFSSLRVGSGESQCRGTNIMLIGNCISLLNAGVLLLLTGYNGRALSCVRDIYESLQNADACLHSADVATNWVDGKEAKKPKGHKYPSIIVLNKRARSILNIWGTHPQVESTMYAWSSLFRLSGRIKDTDRYFVLCDFVTLLGASIDSLSYVLLRHPILVDKVSNIRQRLEDANSLKKSMMAKVVHIHKEFMENKKRLGPYA